MNIPLHALGCKYTWETNILWMLVCGICLLYQQYNVVRLDKCLNLRVSPIHNKTNVEKKISWTCLGKFGVVLLLLQWLLCPGLRRENGIEDLKRDWNVVKKNKSTWTPLIIRGIQKLIWPFRENYFQSLAQISPPIIFAAHPYLYYFLICLEVGKLEICVFWNHQTCSIELPLACPRARMQMVNKG